MRIVLLCHTGLGGSGIVATELALALSELGHEIHIIAEHIPFRLKEETVSSSNRGGLEYRELAGAPATKSWWGKLVELGRKSARYYFGKQTDNSKSTEGNIHFHEFQIFNYPLFEDSSLLTLRAANTIADVVSKYSIEIVHAHYALPHSTRAILARDAGLNIKIVTTLHGTDISVAGRDPALRHMARHALVKSDAVTAVSGALASQANELLDNPIKIFQVPNWVDSNRFQRATSDTERKKYAHKDEIIFIHASNFRPIKRSLDAVRIFAKIQQELPSRLFLIGDGVEKMQCIELAQELGVNGRILSLASTTAIETFLSISDYLLLPSEEESFGLVALEAMSCGVIVVATQVGGLPELITTGENGFLFEVGNVDQAVSQIKSSLTNQDLKEKVTTNARTTAVQKFSPQNAIQGYLEVYKSLLSK